MSVRCIVDVRRLPTILPGVLIASEDFAAADGTPWSSQWQTLRSDGFAEQRNGQGRMQGNSTANGFPYKGIRKALSAINLKNVRVRAQFTPRAVGNGAESYPDISIRQDLSKTGPYPDGYFVSADPGGTGSTAVWTLGKINTNDGQDTATQQDTVVVWTSEPWMIDLSAVNNLITAKVWKVSAGEGSATVKTLTDSQYARSGSIALGYSSGNSVDPGVDWDLVRVYDLGNVATDVTWTWNFTAANGAANVPAAWYPPTGVYGDPAYPTTKPVIDTNSLVIASGSTSPWTGAGSVFLGDPSMPQGDPARSIPAIAPDGTWTFRMQLSSLAEHYPAVGLRLRSADLWPGGGGVNMFRNGGYSLVLGPSNSVVDIIQNYSGESITSFPYTFVSADMQWEIKIEDTTLYVRIWQTGASKPAAWTYSGSNVLLDQSDGNIGFVVANGPAAEQKKMSIDDVVYTAPLLTGVGTTVAAPTTEPSGFTRVYTENFDDVAPAGTGTSSFLNVYSTRVQPYDEVSPNYQQRALLSAHDGVMDVGMNGTQGAAWVYGSAAVANSFIGGRFSARIKTVGAFNNGPAWMIWPSNNAWVEGEIDFPESVSGAGGTQGFQDAPFIHHHTMNTDHPNDQAAAQDVNLLVSWRDWHVYTAEWYPPGKGPTPNQATGLVIYYVDNVEVYRTTTDIPKTNHRFMAQVGAYGQPGNMYVDYVTMATKN